MFIELNASSSLWYSNFDSIMLLTLPKYVNTYTFSRFSSLSFTLLLLHSYSLILGYHVLTFINFGFHVLTFLNLVFMC